MIETIVLHFDLNKTVLTTDPYDHIDSIEIFLWDTIARMAWGEIVFGENNDNQNPDDKQSQAERYKKATWMLKNDTLSQNSPEEGLHTYREYLNFWYPFDRAQNDEALDEQASSYMKDRNFQLLEFISNEGKVFKKTYDKLNQKMTLPAHSKSKSNISDRLKEKYDNRRYNAIPGFFKTLKHLKDQNREFSVVFRTHGRELPIMIEEFNNFCEGNHPAFDGGQNELIKFNGVDSRDLRIKPKQTGMYFRFGKELNDVSLLMNTIERVQCKTHDELLEHYGGQIEEGTIALHSDSIDENYAVIMDTIFKNGSMALQDDFWVYYTNKDDNDYGKLLLIDQNDFSIQNIFFDDMAVEGDTCNVDVRDLATGEKIKEKKFRNKYLVRANIHDAILDDQWFIKQIEICERARDIEIEKLHEGILSSEDEEDVQSVNEFESLKNLPNQEYLIKTVAPLLYQGMNLIASQRPQNPIEFLALYMLQNQHLVKIPVPQ